MCVFVNVRAAIVRFELEDANVSMVHNRKADDDGYDGSERYNDRRGYNHTIKIIRPGSWRVGDLLTTFIIIPNTSARLGSSELV